MEYISFKDQLYFAPASMIIWMKFYLLSDNSFRAAFPEEFDEMSCEFFGKYGIGGGGIKGNGFYIDRFLNDGNIDTFSEIIRTIISSNSFTKNEIYRIADSCAPLRSYDEKVVNSFLREKTLFDERKEYNNLKLHFEALKRALDNHTFYKLATISIDQLAGEWISVQETGALDFNYNMTDFRPLGNRVRLVIRTYNDEFYELLCLVKVRDYKADHDEETTIRASYVKLENGLIHHYYKKEDDFCFRYKRPVYDFNGNSFKTQVSNVGFTFGRKTDSD